MTRDITSGPVRFTLEVKPIPDRIATVRVFVGAVARQMGCSEEDAEDARLAASEACAVAMVGSDAQSGSLSVTAERTDHAVRFTIARRLPQGSDPGAPGPTTSDPPPGLAEVVPGGLDVVRALFADTETVADSSGAAAVSFGVPATPEIRS